MKNSISSLFQLLAISGVLLTGCAPQVEEVQENTEPETSEASESAVEETAEVTDETSSNDYENGTYTATGSYQSPAGPETVTVSLTVENDVVTAVTSSVHSDSDISLRLQGLFAEGIGGEVIGMDLDEIGGYSSVNGSSLTPKGFDDALEQIRAEAELSA